MIKGFMNYQCQAIKNVFYIDKMKDCDIQQSDFINVYIFKKLVFILGQSNSSLKIVRKGVQINERKGRYSGTRVLPVLSVVT